MARNLIPGDIIRFTVVCKDSEQVSLNTFHYLVGLTALAGAEDIDAASNFDTLVAARMKALINNNASYQGVLCQVINPPPILRRQPATLGHGVGNAGATSLPRQVAGLTSWRTGGAGRAERARTYWPFPATADDTGDGVPALSYQGRLAAFSAALIGFTTVTSSGGSVAVTFVIYHPTFNTTSIITDGAPAAAWATQKRRGTFGRANVSPI